MPIHAKTGRTVDHADKEDGHDGDSSLFLPGEFELMKKKENFDNINCRFPFSSLLRSVYLVEFRTLELVLHQEKSTCVCHLKKSEVLHGVVVQS